MIKALIVISLSVIAAGCATPKQALYDAEVDRLCEKDGGVVVYETVAWPASNFDKYGHPRALLHSSPESIYGHEYVTQIERKSIKSGGASVDRLQTSITRRSDGKLLGTSTWYVRAGGDWISGFQPSSHQCPSPAKEVGHYVFMREAK